MRAHPGGKAHSRYLIELAFLEPPAEWLDMGAGDGTTVELLRSLGFRAQGIDLEPRSEIVEQGDYLHCPYADGSFDGILSECSFYSSGDVPGALREAGRLLRRGGKLVFSDVTENVVELLSACRSGGFAVRHLEDLTQAWKEYFLECLWREENVPTGKGLSYVLFVCERM